MFTFGKIRFALLTLCVLVLLCLPQMGFCQTVSIPPTDGVGLAADAADDTNLPKDAEIQKCHAAQQASSDSIVHEKSAYLEGIFNSLDVEANYCWNRIEAMFDFAGLTGDPLGIVWALVKAAFQNLIKTLAAAVCADVLSVVSQVKSFVLSQFNRLCVPLPSLGLGGINLGLQGPPCNGTQLLPIGQFFSTNQRLPGYDPNSLIPVGTAQPGGSH